jgi:HAD superfamily hydrolase (TIGR01549 family)
MACRWVVLDAKGVLYRHGYDVDELLVPYARHRGSIVPAERIRDVYLQASVGAITSAQLWNRLGIPVDGTDQDYCTRHAITDGLRDFLATQRTVRLACLSNDISEWSALLRRRFAIEDAFEAWLVSGDVGLRKPDPRIYALLARRLGVDGSEIIFVDDRPPNLDTAAERGWTTVRFGERCSSHRSAESFDELRQLIDARR